MGQCKVVELLLKRGANPNIKVNRAWFPIHYAVDIGCVKCCKTLVPHYKGDSTLTKLQEPLLMIAAKKGNYNACKELPAEKLDINYKDKDQDTALHIAAKKGFNKFVAFLLELGASPDLPNNYGYTPVMTAVAKNKVDCMTILVRKGVSLTRRSNDGGNILHIAALNKSKKCMAFLLNHIDLKNVINEKDKEGFTPLLLTVQKRNNECLQLLQDAKASLLVGNEDKMSVIYYSPIYRGSNIIQKMLLQENNVHMTNEDKLTPLHIAARDGFSDACKSLLQKGARINACDKNGRTPFHWASNYGHENILKVLLKHGATRRAKDDKNFIALHWAAFTGKLECCKVLLDKDHGLIKLKDKKDKYALDIAFQKGHFKVFTYLLKNFSQIKMQIPEDLTKRFHSYAHKMLNDKKK